MPRVWRAAAWALAWGACRAQPPRPGSWHEAEGYRWREVHAAQGVRSGFTVLAPARTGITDSNAVPDSALALNRHLAQGSGVAAGDVDDDGLVDIYLARIQGPNALYRNLGDWRFEEVAAERGVAAPGRYSTGAVFADVDGDGDLDLLVTALGGPNALFLNDGTGHFTEGRAQAGLASDRGSTTMTLADVDGDGGLDLYVANYKVATALDLFPPEARRFDRVVLKRNGHYAVAPQFREHYRAELRPDLDAVARIERGEPDAFYLNDGSGRFERVSFTGGRFLDSDGRPLREEPDFFALSARFYDVNGDGSPDLYVCNDFSDPDFFWLNDGAGHFRAAPPLALRATSNASMTVDFADINRDGRVDFFVADMLARDRRRRLTQRPTHTPFPKPIGATADRPQMQRNTLFLNRGDGTFAQIAELAGVAASGWTWGAVFLDVDLDGYEDLLLTTGHRWDVMDGDMPARLQSAAGRVDWRRERFLYPELRLPNIAFRNRGDLTFEDASRRWRFGLEPDISHGIAVGDLDGDGDLDVIINRLSAPPLVLRNDAAAPRVAVRLVGRPPNTQGVGAKVRVSGGAVPFQEREVTAGGLYLSHSDYLVSFGAGRAGSVTIEVRWRNGGTSEVRGAQPNRLYEIREDGARPAPVTQSSAGSTAGAPRPLFEDASAMLGHRHHEAPFNDYARQPLLPADLSRLGPGISWIDLDRDGREELLIGTGRGGRVAYYRGAGGRLVAAPLAMPAAEDDYTTILPLPMGQRTALLVGRTSYETGHAGGDPAPASVLQDLPGVTGQASITAAIPGGVASIGPLAMADYDGDGQLDLFVGSRVVPGAWPGPAPSRLFRQVGGRWVEDTMNAAVLAPLELVSAAVFSDLDGDGFPDLLLATDGGPVRVLRNHRGRFHDATDQLGLSSHRSRWNGIATGDFDGDGRLDLVATSWGRNTPVRPSAATPYLTYYGPFGRNGTVALIEGQAARAGGPIYPLTPLSRLGPAAPAFGMRVPTFAAYAEATIPAVLGPSAGGARVVSLTTFDHLLWLNRVDRLQSRPLPVEAQFSPAFAVVVADADGDGHEDVFLSQNFFPMELGTPRYDAGRGLWLLGDGRGGLTPMSGQESGVTVYGDQRGAAVADYDGDGRVDLVVTQNGSETKLYHNVGARPGVRVRLVGPAGNPSGIGAVLGLVYGERRGPVREVQAGSGYWSVNGAVQVLGSWGEPLAVWVRWPGGGEQTVSLQPRQRDVIVAAKR